jgi:hypothetical protein
MPVLAIAHTEAPPVVLADARHIKVINGKA